MAGSGGAAATVGGFQPPLCGEAPETTLREDRWLNLVNASFGLAERGGRNEALAYLDNVLYVFGPNIDPVRDYEGYAVRRMALALRAALERYEDTHRR